MSSTENKFESKVPSVQERKEHNQHDQSNQHNQHNKEEEISTPKYETIDNNSNKNCAYNKLISRENENQEKEASTCPSKPKAQRESSSSNSSYHNRRRKKSETSRSRSFKKKKKRTRSHSKDRYRSRSRSRNNKKKKHKRDKHRRRSRSRSRSSSEETIKKRNYFEERRKGRNRDRSNSALRVMKLKTLENACGYYQRYYQRPHEDDDPSKPQKHWDGYQWITRPTTVPDNSFEIIKPGRKAMIANIPLHMNIKPDLFKDYLTKLIIDKDLISKKDVKDFKTIIRGIELDFDNNSAVVALESTELAKRMVLLDGSVLLGHTLRFSLYQDVNKTDHASNVVKASALANSAHLSAKSAAIAFAALKSLNGKNETVQLNLDGDVQTGLPSTKVVKVMNLLDPKDASKVKSEKLDEILDDIREEFSKFGNIITAIIISQKKEKLGAEVGAVFVEFQEIKSAENAVKSMKNKRYEGKEIKMAFLDENVFKNEIL